MSSAGWSGSSCTKNSGMLEWYADVVAFLVQPYGSGGGQPDLTLSSCATPMNAWLLRLWEAPMCEAQGDTPISITA